MNENVTNKTPKRRRWISRLLVSALCILLASSLLFVGVVAENIELVAQFSSSYSIDGVTTTGVYYLSATAFVYCRNDVLHFYDSGTLLSSLSVDMNGPTCFSLDGAYLYVCSCSYSTSSGFQPILAEVNISDLSSPSLIRRRTFNYFGGYSAGKYPIISFVVKDGLFCGYLYADYSTTVSKSYAFVYDFESSELLADYLADTSLGYLVSSNNYSLSNSCFVVDDVLYSLAAGCAFSLVSYSRLESYSEERSSIFFYNDSYYAIGETKLYRFDSSLRSFETVGNSPGVPVTSYAENGILYCITSKGADSLLPYTVYSGLPTTETPPESSDETTEEPPPESSEDSSDEPGQGGTKIWSSILNADGSYTSSLLGTLDLSQATEVRAYIGSWTSKDSSYQSETPVPLTFYVYSSEEGSPDIYTFDYYAAGFSLLGDSVSDFTFPDVIGQFFILPYNGETDLYFANVSPCGTVLVSTPFGDSFGGRVMLNLVSADSYFRLDFVDEDTFTVVVYNEDPVGSRVTFEMDIRAYREGFRLEDGETTSSRWFYPSFGSSTSYTAEYVIENGLYLVFVDSVNDTVYPWEDGTWSDIIGDANSRHEDISADHALLESMANDAYGQYSFDPMTNQNFVGAVSQFNDIRDSSGGDYILRYMWGMWNIHPFASSMIAIVGTLAIVGFIIRKM